MKTAVRLAAVLFLLALALGGLFAWKSMRQAEQQAQRNQPPPATAVEAVTVENAQWRAELRAVGSLRALNGIEVANEVAGVVSELAFESGQRVHRGDRLLHLEDSVDRAALAALEARARLAQETFDRFSDLVTRKAVSQSQYDEARANYQAAEADVAQQRARLDKKQVRAPFDGVLGLRRVDLGEYIGIGTPIVELSMLDPIEVDYSVPERHLNQVTPGRNVEVRVSAYPEEVFRGQVLAVAPAVNESSRTLDVRARLANPQGRLRPGMFADVRTLAETSRPVLNLPRTALSFNTYGDFVFRLASNDQGDLVAQRRQVTTGATRGDRVEIVDGLEPGDRVVATGLLRLRDGQPVKVAGDESAPAEKAARP